MQYLKDVDILSPLVCLCVYIHEYSEDKAQSVSLMRFNPLNEMHSDVITYNYKIKIKGTVVSPRVFDEFCFYTPINAMMTYPEAELCWFR